MVQILCNRHFKQEIYSREVQIRSRSDSGTSSVQEQPTINNLLMKNKPFSFTYGDIIKRNGCSRSYRESFMFLPHKDLRNRNSGQGAEVIKKDSLLSSSLNVPQGVFIGR